MSANDRIPVVPAVLEWARITAGLNTSAAAKKLGISEASLTKWETGDLLPTIKQLRKLAKVYRRPLAVLLLPRPPKDFSPLRDFRRTAAGQGSAWSPPLHAEFKRALSQREVFLELAEIAPGSVNRDTELPRIDRSRDEAELVAEQIRSLLRLDEITSIQWTRPHELLNRCIDGVEELGILVVQTQGVELNEMRAFSVSEWPFAVIALNGKDWPRPRLFSLFHELCHLMLNTGGLCDLHEEQRGKRAVDDEIEHYCNQVAAAILMPRDSVLSEPLVQAASRSYEWSLEELRQVGRVFGASAEALLLRLISLQKAEWALYWRRKPELEAQYEQARAEEKARQREAEGGPSYYTVKARDLGHGYVSSVLDAFRSHAISSLDVADYLDVRYDQIPKLEKVIRT